MQSRNVANQAEAAGPRGCWAPTDPPFDQTTVRRTSTLPRVALEWGRAWWAFSTSASASAPGEARQRDGEIDVETEAAGRAQADADGGGDRGVGRNLRAALRGHELHRADEAGGVAGRKQLLGIVAGAASAAELLRRRELDVERAVEGRRRGRRGRRWLWRWSCTGRLPTFSVSLRSSGWGGTYIANN